MVYRTQGPKGNEVPREIIIEIFEKVVVEIVAMAEQQIKDFNKKNLSTHRKIQSIIFVGGLSGSQYVVDRLQSEFSGPNSLIGYEAKVLRPNKDASIHVVSKGAVLKALFEPVADKVLAQSFGISWDEDFNLDYHGNVKAEPDAADGRLQALDRMCWLFRRGEIIRTQQLSVSRIRGWRTVPPTGPTYIQETIYASYSETRDHVRAYAKSESATLHPFVPMSLHLSDIHTIGNLRLDLSDLDRSRFPKMRIYKDSTEYVRMNYEVQLKFDGL